VIASAEVYPRLHQLPITFDRVNPNDYIGGFEVRDTLNGSLGLNGGTVQPNTGLVGSALYPLVCLVENQGDVDLVAAIHQSNDNGFSDAFAAVNLRYNGGTATSVTVKPRCKVLFTVETLTKKWIKADVNVVVGGLGRFSLWHFTGILVPTQRVSTVAP